MNKPKGLGRGLDALLGAGDEAERGGRDATGTLPIGAIRPGKYQPRTRMNEQALNELAASIKAQGLMQPLLVRPIGADSYELIAGERRWRAARIAGLSEVPALIRQVPDNAALAMALVENIQRENLNPLEEARALTRLITEFGLTHQEAAEAVGRSRAGVSNLLRLLEVPAEVAELLEKRSLEMGHARALLGLSGKRQQIEVALLVAKKGLSVRETEALVRRLTAPTVHGRDGDGVPPRDPNVERLEQELAEKLGTRVAIQHSARGGGKLVVSYHSLDELDGILAHIR